MSDNVLIAIVGLLSAFLSGGGVLAYVALKKSKSEIKVNESQPIAVAGKAVSDAAMVLSSILNEAEEQSNLLRQQNKEVRENNTALVARLVDIETKANEADKKANELEKRANEADRLREERTVQLSESNDKIEALEAVTAALRKQIEKDTAETVTLRSEVGILRGQVTELQDKNAKYTRIIGKLLAALDEAKITRPDLNSDLTDTLRKFQLPKSGDK